MPSHARFKGQQFHADDQRSKGAYSRRQQSGEAYESYRDGRIADEKDFWALIEKNKAARKKRGVSGQLKMLDSMFGKGKGAVKERKRLALKIERARKAFHVDKKKK